MVQEKLNLSHSPIVQLLQERHINLPFVKFVAKGETIHKSDFIPAQHTKALLIADDASMNAALESLGDCVSDLTKLIFPAPAKPVFEKEVSIALQKAKDVAADYIIVVGSGSLSDIGKFVANEMGIPFTIIATAPSMNGYFSANASIGKDNLKQSVECKQVNSLIIFESIIVHSPTHINQAGKADALSSITASIDMEFASRCMGKKIDERIFASQVNLFPKADDPIKLMELLLVQGLTMTAAGSSAPASGGEHMLAHLLEMLQPETYAQMLHGELIGRILPAYAVYQAALLSKPQPSLRKLPAQEELQHYFAQHWPVIEPLYEKKINMLGEHELSTNQTLQQHWPRFCKASLQKLELLKKCYSSVTQQPLNEELLQLAWLTRDRLTLLDLC